MKKIFFLLIITINLHALCAYSDCSNVVTAKTTQTQVEMESEFQAVMAQLNNLEENYRKYSVALEENNALYEKNKTLKKEYLIILKKINQKIDLLRKIEAAKRKP